jgi:hypothetical protein
MPSLREASGGASTLSARTIFTPLGSSKRGSGMCRPIRGASRTSALETSCTSTSSSCSAASSRGFSSLNSAAPSQSLTMKASSIWSARSTSSSGTGFPLASR